MDGVDFSKGIDGNGHRYATLTHRSTLRHDACDIARCIDMVDNRTRDISVEVEFFNTAIAPYFFFDCGHNHAWVVSKTAHFFPPNRHQRRRF